MCVAAAIAARTPSASSNASTSGPAARRVAIICQPSARNRAARRDAV